MAKALGILGLCADIPLAWGWIIGLAVGCGLIRGGLRYPEQYSNHYIAFKLLAVLRDRIFGALRVLCPAKLESKQKGSKAWYKKVGVVYQNPDYQLFMPTVRQEISFGAKSEEYAAEIAELFGVKHFGNVTRSPSPKARSAAYR